MSDILNKLLEQANQAAAESGIDMNEAVTGGGGGRLLPAGYAFAQLVEYVELGKQPQEFGGKAKEPALEVQLGFALTGSAADPEDPTKVIPYNNDDGTPYIMRPWPFAISRNEKARAFTLFKALNWKRTATSFAQLLGQKFLVKIVHEPKSKSDPKIVSRMDLKSFLPPLNPVGNTPYQIQDADPALYKLFLWTHPTLEAWNALKVEGTFEVEEGGKKVQKSKNRVQESILGALDFEGSPLHMLLAGAGVQVPSKAPTSPATPYAAVPATQVAAVPATPAVAPPVTPAAVPVQEVAAPLVTPAPAVVAPAAAPAGVQVPATPVAVMPVQPSSPVLPA